MIRSARNAAIVAAVCAFTTLCVAADKPIAATGGAKGAAISAGSAKQSVDTLVLTARIIEIPGKFPPNDLYSYVYIMKYRVVKIEKGTYTGTDILVGQYNPLIPRSQIKDKMSKMVSGSVDKFEVGATHRITLIKPIDKVWKDAVEDEYFDSELDKFYALKTDMAK